MAEPNSLPKHGALPRPTDVETARELLKSESFPVPDVQLVAITAIEPAWTRVEVRRNARGGISIIAADERSAE